MPLTARSVLLLVACCALAGAVEWQSRGQLASPLALGSAVQWNGTILVVGGCEAAGCRAQGSDRVKDNGSHGHYGTATLSTYDLASAAAGQVSVDLPEPLLGLHSSIIAATNASSTPQIISPRACAVLLPDRVAWARQRADGWRKLMRLHSSVALVAIPSVANLTIPSVEYAVLPEAVANASCVVYARFLYIIGGVTLSEAGDVSPRTSIDKIDLTLAPHDPRFHTKGAAAFNISDVLSCGRPNMFENVASAASSAAIYIAVVCARAGELFPYVRLYVLFPTRADALRPYVPDTVVPTTNDGTVSFFPQLATFGEFVYLTDTTFLLRLRVSQSQVPSWSIIPGVGGSPVLGWSSITAVAVPSIFSGTTCTLFACGGSVAPASSATQPNMTALVQWEGTDEREPGIAVLTVPAASSLSGAAQSWYPGSMTGVAVPLGRPFIVGLSTAGGPRSRLRLSQLIDCSDSIGDVTWAQGTRHVALTPAVVTSTLFVCASSGQYIETYYTNGTRGPNEDLYTCMNSVTPFAVEPAPPLPTEAPSESLREWFARPAHVAFIVLGCGCLCTFAAILLIQRHRRRSALLSYISLPHREQVARVNIEGTGKYTVVRKIGSGGNGEVFLVRRRGDKAILAVKHVAVFGRRGRAAGLQETDLVASLRGHPGAIGIIEMSLTEQYVVVASAEDRRVEQLRGARLERAHYAQTHPTPRESQAAPGAINGADSRLASGARGMHYSPSAGSLASHRADEASPLLTDTEEPASTAASTAVVSPPRKQRAQQELVRFQCIAMPYHRMGSLSAFLSTSARRRRSSVLVAPGADDTVHGGALGPGGRVLEPALVSVGMQVLAVLHQLHTRAPDPVAHCDIKLENILVADHIPPEYIARTSPFLPRALRKASSMRWSGGDAPIGKDAFLPVVVTDFGLAMVVPDAAARAGAIALEAFTLPYVPPECMDSGLMGVTTKIDIWALGCALYFVATGQLDATEADSSESATAAAREGWIDADSEVPGRRTILLFEQAEGTGFQARISEEITAAGYSPALAAWVSSMLARTPQERPSAADLLASIRRVGLLEYAIESLS